MSFLNDNWEKMNTIDPEYVDIIPMKFSQDYMQSWNSTDKSMLIMRNFLRLRTPAVVIECGTFEARFTEMAARTMALYYTEKPKKIITIDVAKDLSHIEETFGTFRESALFDQVVDIRKRRLQFLELYKSRVEVIYEEGLTQNLLPGLIDKHHPEFVYEDALHLPELMKYEWNLIKDKFRRGDIVCFDDAHINKEFFDWLKETASDWIWKISDPNDHPQFWMEKL